MSNVACGFDVLGFALDEPGDIVFAAAADHPGVTIASIEGDDGRVSGSGPQHRRRGRPGAARPPADDARRALTVHKGLPLERHRLERASAVAAVVAANELLGRPVGTDVLLACAMAGEQAGCGAPHPTTSRRRCAAASSWHAR